MTDKSKKTLIKSTLLLIVGIIIIALYCITPKKELEEPVEKYLINFDSTGGSAIAAITIEEGDSLNQPEAPTRDGYVFVGWMLDDEYYDFSKDISGDITLRAVWKEAEPDKVYYTVTFDTVGGNSIANQMIEKGQVATRPAVYPIREGYTFTGWTLNGTDYDFNSPVTGDITITAGWEEVKKEEPEDPSKPTETTYTVRFNANGGTLVSGCGNQTVKSGEIARNTCTATRNGYTLVGFSTNRNASSQNLTSRRITSNVTYYAIWKQNQVTPPPVVEPPKVVTYSLSFDANGGNLGNGCPNPGSVRTVNEGTNLNSVCTVSRPHYQFTGWTVNGRAVTTAVATGMYQANWRMNTFKVGCRGNDDQITNITCTLFITENGKEISGATIKINGKKATTVNKARVWEKIDSVQFDYDGLTNITATK